LSEACIVRERGVGAEEAGGGADFVDGERREGVRGGG